MNFLSYYLTLYYVIILCLLYFSTRKYLKINNFPLIIILSLYFVAATLAIFGFVNDLNVISIDIDTKNCLDELDFAVDIPETVQDNQISNKPSSDNIFLKFLSLFNNDNIHNSLRTELKNTYYLNDCRTYSEFNTLNLADLREKYDYQLAHNQEVLYFIECFTDILDDLEVIKDNLGSKRNN